jgi:hypothetical protein
MVSTPGMLLVGACLVSLAVVTPAGAQRSNDSSFDPFGLSQRKPAPGLADVKPQPLAWPRLDPGAVLCRTEDDLDKLAARRHGESVEGPIDCKIIRAATAISIVQRKGPGRAEVKTSIPGSDGVTGWTDAWLPDKRGAGATSASR